MSDLDLAKKIASDYLDEIEANISIRLSYNSILVAKAQTFFYAFKDDKKAFEELKSVLKHKTVDTGSFFKPLVVQVNGVFENYIRSLVKAVVEERYEVAPNYQALDVGFRNDHLAHVAKILIGIKSGAVMGVAYNFDNLLTNLGKSLSGSSGFKLNHEVYTRVMGNCTSARLTDLFLSLSLPDPFSEALGQNLKLKNYFADRTKGRVADRAKEELDKQISLRNDIVHGDLTRSVDLNELNEAIGFFRALICSLHDLVDVKQSV